MINEIQKLLDEYLIWLRDKTLLKQIDNWVEITTPYLDRNNDCLQIYASQQNGGYLLTDDGFTISDLEESGCKLQTQERQCLLKMILAGFGVQTDGKSLIARASSDNFGLRKHNLVQAMLAVSAVFSCIDTKGELDQ